MLIEPPSGGRRRRLTVLNARADHDRLIEALRGYDAPVVAGFEATGDYHWALAWRLGEAGFTVRLISSVALARMREPPHKGWDKNDPNDAPLILHMLRASASLSTTRSAKGSTTCRSFPKPTTPSRG